MAESCESMSKNGLSQIEWYVIPWGTRDKTVLRLGLRAMPNLTCDDTKMCADAANALADWPRFVANISGEIEVKYQGASYTQLLKVPLGKIYRHRLEKEWKLSVEQASTIWREMFGDMTPPPEKRQPRQSPSVRMLHRSDELADSTGLSLGELYADSLGLTTGLVRGEQAMLESNTPASPAIGQQLRSLARVYSPIDERRHPEQVAQEMRNHADKLAKASNDGHRQEKQVAGWMSSVLTAGADIQKLEKGGKASSMRSTAPALSLSREALAYALKCSVTDRPDFNDAKLLGDEDPVPLSQLAAGYLKRRIAHLPDPKPKENVVPDMHQALAGIASQPWLAKVLGLSIDVDVCFDRDVPTFDEIGLVSMIVAHQCVTPDVVMWTQVEMATGEPFPKSKHPNAYREGMLDISASQGSFQINLLDVDRTPEKLMQSAIAYDTELRSGRLPSEITVSIQPQETVGLALIEKFGTDECELRRKLIHAPRQEGGPNGSKKIFLENLLLGYRPDTQQFVPDRDAATLTPTAWKPLAARTLRRVLLGRRDITDWFAGIGIDEGVVVERGRRVINGADGDGALLMEGELFRWGTWGLGTAHPNIGSAQVIGDAAQTRTGQLRVEYASALGQPVQRFGSGYRIGIRLVMIDGNSIPLNEAVRRGYDSGFGGRVTSLGNADVSDEIGAVPFLRFEHVAPPGVLLINHPDRANFPRESARHVPVGTSLHGEHSHRNSRRVLVPPRCASLDLAIRHGSFERFRDTSAPESAFSDVVLTDRGDFPAWLHAFLGVPTPKTTTSERYFNRLTEPAIPPKIPYYPDPWAEKMILGFYRRGDNRLMYVDYFNYYDDSHTWPNCRELQLEVCTSDDAKDPILGFDVELKGNVMTVRMVKGTDLVLRVWHEIDQKKLNQSAVVDQIIQAAMNAKTGPAICQCVGLPAPSDLDEVRECVVRALSQWEQRRDWAGQTPRPFDRKSDILNLTSFWMINPYEEIELVHAVDQPLRPAVLAEASQKETSRPRVLQAPSRTSALETPFRIWREKGASSVSFEGHLRFHRATTKRIDAEANWLDNSRKAVLNAKKSQYELRSESRAALLFSVRDIVPVAECDTGDLPINPKSPELDASQNLQRVDASITLPGSGKKINITDPFDFGDTRARVVDVKLRSGGRFFDTYLPAADHSLVSPARRVIVPGGQRPDAPEIEYVIPLYAWATDAAQGGGAHRSREAGWFRIWLGTDWYSSGNGELLALVCWPPTIFDPTPRGRLFRRGEDPDAFKSPPSIIENYVTRWGLDPLLRETITFRNLSASSLTNRIRSYNDLARVANANPINATDLHHLQDVPTFEPQFDLACLPELGSSCKPSSGAELKGDTVVSLALFRLECDATSGRWFADICIQPGTAYQPFVRLALARYQPHALPELRLSAIVNTECIQLLPGRDVTVVPLGASKNMLAYSVTLAGNALTTGGVDSKSRSEFKVSIDAQPYGVVAAHEDENINGAWMPVDEGKASSNMEYVRRDSLWRAGIEFERKLSHRYSMRIEEYEVIENVSGDRVSKLVYFDRIMLIA
jgi:hypothetical protein